MTPRFQRVYTGFAQIDWHYILDYCGCDCCNTKVIVIVVVLLSKEYNTIEYNTIQSDQEIGFLVFMVWQMRRSSPEISTTLLLYSAQQLYTSLRSIFYCACVRVATTHSHISPKIVFRHVIFSIIPNGWSLVLLYLNYTYINTI